MLQEIFISVSWGNTKEITAFFFPGSCQNNQCFPERASWCDREERRQEGADVAPGLRLEIISEEQSLGLFYSYQDSSYLTCILVFTQSPP